MVDFWQLTLAGVTQGSIYAVRHVINVAQGDLAVLATLGAIWMVRDGVPLLGAVVLAIASVTLVSVALDRLVLARVRELTTLVSLILTLGVSTVLQAGMLLAWGTDSRGLPVFPGADVDLAGVSVRAQEFWVLGALVVVGGGVVLFYDTTRWGKALRATAEQPVAARIVGISPVLASVVAFAVAGAVAGTAGVVASPLTLSGWSGGVLLTLKGFVAAALGGFSSFKAAIVGAVLLGVVESHVAGYVATGLRDAVAFLVLILVLVLRPQGLVLKRSAVRV